MDKRFVLRAFLLGKAAQHGHEFGHTEIGAWAEEATWEWKKKVLESNAERTFRKIARDHRLGLAPSETKLGKLIKVSEQPLTYKYERIQQQTTERPKPKEEHPALFQIEDCGRQPEKDWSFLRKKNAAYDPRLCEVSSGGTAGAQEEPAHSASQA